MKKEFRLKKASDFRKVFREGKKILSPHFVLFRLENSLKSPRLGVSISRKHVKRAVDRNRLRRVAREAFRLNVEKAERASDIVIASKKSADDEGLKNVEKELKDLTERVVNG